MADGQRRDGRSAALKGTARERLLDAALAELHERGYDAASLSSIARRAGLTKGAVYWNFAGKDDLFAALVEARFVAPVRELIALTATAPAAVPTAPTVSEGVMRLVRERPELLLLRHEQWARAARDERERDAYRARQDELTGALAAALAARHEHTGVALTMRADRLATAVIALGSGLAAEALVNADAVDDDLLGDMLDLIYDGLAARARGDAPR